MKRPPPAPNKPPPPSRKLRFGPGLIVAAAFIGPGTVTTASIAGARFGSALVWALGFSVVATIVLQEMSARLGLVTRKGLGEALRSTFSTPAARILVSILVVSAIAVGNAAYEMGNITGASLGLEGLTGVSKGVWSLVVGTLAFALLAGGRYRLLERSMIALVGVMSLVFIVTAIGVGPNWSKLAGDLLSPRLPAGSLLTVVALIGTTVVPYNLFLHASAVHQKWAASDPLPSSLRSARIDTVVSILLGGAVTLAIMVTAASFHGDRVVIDSATQMAQQLEPLLGRWAKSFFAAGLLAAGLTSAITAPLAAAYATAGVLGWTGGMKSSKFKMVWATIIIAGTTLAFFGKKPVQAIVFAQAANGVLLPLVAVFLLVAVNRKKLLGEHANGAVANLLGGTVVLIAAGIGSFLLYKVARVVFS